MVTSSANFKSAGKAMRPMQRTQRILQADSAEDAKQFLKQVSVGVVLELRASHLQTALAP